MDIEYWKTDAIIGSEAFAHFFSASTINNSRKLESIQAVFPNAYEEFLKIVGEMTEDQIPKFLRRTPDNGKKELSRFAKLIDIYESKFYDFPPTEPSVWEEELWCGILEMCIKEGKTVDELLGFDSEESEDFDD